MVYLPPVLLCQLLYRDGLPTSSTSLPAVWRWSTYLQYSSASCCMEMVYLPPVLLCQLLYGDGLPTSSIPLPAAVWYGLPTSSTPLAGCCMIRSTYLQYSSASCCMVWSTYLQYSSASCCMDMACAAGDFSCTSYLKLTRHTIFRLTCSRSALV